MRFALALLLVSACGSASTKDGADAPPGGGADGPPGAVDAPPPAGDGVACGELGSPMLCEPGQVCCRQTPAVCQPPAQACPGAIIACDGPEDCPGQECCGDPIGGMACFDACNTLPEICHDPSSCPAGQMCCGFGGGPAMDTYQHCSSGPCPL